MPGYLEGYGVGEARREKRLKYIVISVLAVVVVFGSLYLIFRNYRELKRAELFLELLRNKDYQTAYRLWGCTDPSAPPCHDYPFDKFMEDWGPMSAHGNPAAAKIKKVHGCADGVFVTVEFAPNQEDLLWVERKDRAMGFAPYSVPVCNPRLPAP